MSYSIIYDKQFLKVKENGKEKFAPIVLTGDNNCYDVNNRRSRSWWNWTYFTNGDGFATLEEMLAKCESGRKKIKETNKEYNDKNWGFYIGLSFGGGCNATFGQYLGIFKTGCKKAITVEQIREFYGSVNVRTGYFDDKTLEKHGKERVFVSVTTSKQLVEEYRKAEEYLKGTGLTPLIELNANEGIAKRIRSLLFSKPKREKKRIVQNFHFVVKDFKEDNYVVKAQRNGYSFSRFGKDYAKKFRNEKEAEKYANKLSLKYHEENRFIVEPVEKEAVFYK